MQPTNRAWASAALVGFLAALAVVFARPLLLAGAGLVGAWVLATQDAFVSDLERTIHSCSVHQSADRTGVVADESTPATLEITCQTPTPLSITVQGGLPTATRADDSFELTLEPDETTGNRTVEVTWPVTGTHRFEAATVTVSDGWFVETVSMGHTPTVTVEPHGPRSVHVGVGGNRIATAYGEHESGRIGSGIEPAGIREYVPGDTAARIDWKATARLAKPHIREYEAETDRQTLLVVDHRSHLEMGPPAETKLEYLREAALMIAGSVHQLGDPLGLLTVGDEGITQHLEARSSPEQFAAVRRRVLGLEATSSGGNDGSHHPSQSTETTTTQHITHSTGVDARRIAATLEGDHSRFATLQPFYTDRQRYRTRLESDPLSGAVRTALAHRRGTVWTVLLTDDSSPRELRETVDAARQNGNRVTLLLAPTALYEPGGFADVERTYDQYVAFERLRRDLARMERVTAFEVGPGDRLSRVLAAGQSRRGAQAHTTPSERPDSNPQSASGTEYDSASSADSSGGHV